MQRHFRWRPSSGYSSCNVVPKFDMSLLFAFDKFQKFQIKKQSVMDRKDPMINLYILPRDQEFTHPTYIFKRNNVENYNFDQKMMLMKETRSRTLEIPTYHPQQNEEDQKKDLDFVSVFQSQQSFESSVIEQQFFSRHYLHNNGIHFLDEQIYPLPNSIYSRRPMEVTETGVSETSKFSQYPFSFRSDNALSLNQYRKYSTLHSQTTIETSNHSIDSQARGDQDINWISKSKKSKRSQSLASFSPLNRTRGITFSSPPSSPSPPSPFIKVSKNEKQKTKEKQITSNQNRKITLKQTFKNDNITMEPNQILNNRSQKMEKMQSLNKEIKTLKKQTSNNESPGKFKKLVLNDENKKETKLKTINESQKTRKKQTPDNQSQGSVSPLSSTVPLNPKAQKLPPIPNQLAFGNVGKNRKIPKSKIALIEQLGFQLSSETRRKSSPIPSKNVPNKLTRPSILPKVSSSPRKKNASGIIYTMEYIKRTYDTKTVSSNKENAIWAVNPKNFLLDTVEYELKWELLGPANQRFHRATVTIQLNDTTIAVQGDGLTKKEAERLAVLHICYELYTKGLIPELIKRKSELKATEKIETEAKKHVFEYCARFDHVPVFNTSEINNKFWEATVELPSQEIIGFGRGKVRKDAELLAAADFKKKAEEYQLRHGGESISQTQNKYLTEEISRDFLQFYSKYKKLKNPELKSNLIDKNSWEGSISIGNKVVGVSRQESKNDAHMAAYFEAAISLRKEHTEVWSKFESKGGLKPTVHFTIGDTTSRLLQRLVDETRRAPMFQKKAVNLTSKNERIKPEAKDQPPEPEQLKVLEAVSEKLYDKHQEYLNSKETLKMRSIRDQLPITQYSGPILEAIENNLVTIIVGSTGCGKTTQLPQILFEDAIQKRKGAQCNIIVTQPRRIAAISVAQRVAVERSEKLGQTVGYQVRFENQMPSKTGSILFCTTGLFLRRLHDEISAKDPFEGITHIVVDEVHERDINADFLLVILKRILDERRRNNRSPIKLILMSATIDSGAFAEYFGTFSSNGRCPIIEVPGKIYPVRQFYLDEIIPKLRLLYPSDAKRLDSKDTQRYLDHENKFLPDMKPSPNNDLCLLSSEQPIKTIVAKNSDEVNSQIAEIDDNGKVSLSSSSGRIIDWGGSRFFDKERADAQVPFDLIALVLAHIVKTGREGGILIFLPGWEEITTLNRLLAASPLPLGVNFSDPSRFQIHMLHSSVTSAVQRQAFEPLPKPGMRKIIIATNIAETSITIPDIVYVIDSGKLKEKRYDQSKRMTSLITTWVSQSNARQRAGRAGRVREGEYYAMMSRTRYQNLEGFSTPELLRSDLQEICLQIKALDLPATISDVLAQAIEPPEEATVKAALDNLKSLQALDASEEMTPLGKVLSTLPIEPGLGKMVLLGAIFQCLDPILTIAASMTLKSPFMVPPGARQRADAIRNQWSQGLSSDHFAVLNVYEAWYKLYVTGNDFQFCRKNLLSRTGMQMIAKTKGQLLNILERGRVIPRSFNNTKEMNSNDLALGPSEYNRYSNCTPLLRGMICAGVYPNISILSSKRMTTTQHEKSALFHPSSVNFASKSSSRQKTKASNNDQGFLPGTLFAYTSKTKTIDQQVFIRDITRIDPLSAVLFGGEITSQKDKRLVLTVDEWLRFTGSNNTLNNVTTLKNLLDHCLTEVYQGFGRFSRPSNVDEKVKNRLVEGIAEVIHELDQDIKEFRGKSFIFYND
ncbi:hypothetical protein G9A89_017504 [Geosiphon pyriformis]|nr:hypothetical protein G9A89_017504 [Geosiphon pyriformis]